VLQFVVSVHKQLQKQNFSLQLSPGFHFSLIAVVADWAAEEVACFTHKQGGFVATTNLGHDALWVLLVIRNAKAAATLIRYFAICIQPLDILESVSAHQLLFT